MVNEYLKTGSAKIDDLLGKGLEFGEITHFFGENGSGKTTTLYATLNKLNSSDKKIITIENSVEYQLDGINQI